MNPLVNLLEKFVTKAEMCTRALVEENVMSEGGLVTASKTWIRAAIEVINELQRVELSNDEIRRIEALLPIVGRAMDRVAMKIRDENEYYRKRLEELHRKFKWLRRRLEDLIQAKRCTQ